MRSIVAASISPRGLAPAAPKSAEASKGLTTRRRACPQYRFRAGARRAQGLHRALQRHPQAAESPAGKAFPKLAEAVRRALLALGLEREHVLLKHDGQLPRTGSRCLFIMVIGIPAKNAQGCKVVFQRAGCFLRHRAREFNGLHTRRDSFRRRGGSGRDFGRSCRRGRFRFTGCRRRRAFHMQSVGTVLCGRQVEQRMKRTGILRKRELMEWRFCRGSHGSDPLSRRYRRASYHSTIT